MWHDPSSYQKVLCHIISKALYTIEILQERNPVSIDKHQHIPEMASSQIPTDGHVEGNSVPAEPAAPTAIEAGEVDDGHGDTRPSLLRVGHEVPTNSFQNDWL